MNNNTLEDYLYDINLLINSFGLENPTKADDLRIKVSNALKELDLYDSSTVTIDFLKFKRFHSSLPSPYRESLNKIKSILESKIEVYNHRIEKQIQKKELAVQAVDSIKDDTIKKLSADIQRLKSQLVLLKEENEKEKRNANNLNVQILDLNIKLKKKDVINSLKSLGVWSFIIMIFLGLLAFVYQYGKDVTVKNDDEFKTSIQNENLKLNQVVDSLNIVINNLKKKH
ncbi:hypothetical protein [Sphingobacterium mizutaii]|uniref:hypothetical protein n=1 Tax=Sphingobacterium mizutaii TaxID=1010 RepID=UPI0016279483|nr:hypothetical protein [Sphingobacterium mizutaii]